VTARTAEVVTVTYDPDKRKIYLFDEKGRFLTAVTQYNLLELKKYKSKIANKDELKRAIYDMVKVVRENGKLKLYYYYDEDFIRFCKEVGARWNRRERCWELPTAMITRPVANSILQYYRFRAKELAPMLKQILDENAQKVAFSRATGAGIEVPLPPGKRLYPFQLAGVKFTLDNGGRVLFGDEMGLGKTVQSIAFLNAKTKEEVFPLLVVCPNNVKYKWAEYLKEWCIHDPKVCMLSGRNPEVPAGYDAYVINYDVLYDKLESLERLGIKTLIVDEIRRDSLRKKPAR